MTQNKYQNIITNEEVNQNKLDRADAIISELYHKMPKYIANGHGPFLAAIYDNDGNLIAESANSVLSDKCSNNHAETNVIRAAEEKLGTHDLSKYNLSLYITAEPCMMCIGAIMWSGIRAVYYGVPSITVEKITGFDEGFKPNWLHEFATRNITVYGNIAPESGERVLRDYVTNNGTIYKPKRTY